MQVSCKVEQPSSASSSPINLPKNSDDDFMEKFTNYLEEGQQSAHKIKMILLDQRLGLKVENDNDNHRQIVAHLCGVTLNSFYACLSMLKDCGFDHQHLTKKRKFDHSKSQQTNAALVPKEKRGCYKRRRNDQPRVVETINLVDDGYAWRKYGQKDILKTKYPRAYYRCTHKHDQKCQATKQVQQISEDPNKYMIIYYNYHTCKDPLKNPSIIIDSLEEESKSVIVNFGTNNYSTPKQALNPSTLFPSTAFPSNTSTSIKVDSPSPPHDYHYHHDHHHHHHHHHSLQYSSSSDNHVPYSPDLTSSGLLPSTPVSQQSSEMSPAAEIYSSTTSPYDMDDDFLLSLLNMNYLEHAHFDNFMDCI